MLLIVALAVCLLERLYRSLVPVEPCSLLRDEVSHRLSIDRKFLFVFLGRRNVGGQHLKLQSDFFLLLQDVIGVGDEHIDRLTKCLDLDVDLGDLLECAGVLLLHLVKSSKNILN